jgi:hypothetical protein
MKILYLIFSKTKYSGGGHFYSLVTLVDSLNSEFNCRILNLGNTNPEILINRNDSFYIHINSFNIFYKIFHLINNVKHDMPHVIHAYDWRAHYFGRIISFLFNIPLIYTKCGGSNSQYFIPNSTTYILFSKENYTHYKKYINNNLIHLIPNRVKKVKSNLFDIINLKNDNNLCNKKIILKISRFNEYYDLTFTQSINLLNKLNHYSSDYVLIFIGEIQSQEFYDKIKSNCKLLPVIFITDKYYTTNSSRLIDCGDIIVGTGRGAMEACSLNKIVFCPVSNYHLPIILNDKTIDNLFHFNFSERISVNEDIINIENYNYFNNNKYNFDSYSLFQKYFSIDNVINQYFDIYKNVLYLKKKHKYFNFIYHSFIFFKS